VCWPTGWRLHVALVVNLFQDNLTAGLGFAVALVYFGGWRPAGILIGALLFSFINSLQLFMQVTKVGISADLANMLPYIITIIVLMFPINRARQPAALNKPFERGEN
jgi:simple sugar transport system permease protein